MGCLLVVQLVEPIHGGDQSCGPGRLKSLKEPDVGYHGPLSAVGHLGPVQRHLDGPQPNGTANTMVVVDGGQWLIT